MHNIVVGEEDLDMLGNLFAGKSFLERAVLLNRIFTTGLRLVVANAPSRGSLRRNPASEI
jgi:hypothetical protein